MITLHLLERHCKAHVMVEGEGEAFQGQRGWEDFGFQFGFGGGCHGTQWITMAFLLSLLSGQSCALMVTGVVLLTAGATRLATGAPQ